LAKFNAILSVSFNEVDYSSLYSSDDFKQWAAISGNSLNDLIDIVLPTAAKQCEDYVNLAFTERIATVEVCNLLGSVQLPYNPIATITSVKNADNETVEYIFLAGQLKTPENDYLKVVYNCGYETLNPLFLTAIYNQALWLIDNRGDESLTEKLSPNAMLILKPYRVVV